MISSTTGVYPKKSINFGSVYTKFISGLGSNTGSVTSFLGVARSESARGKRKTKYLVMESYKEHANRVLNRICAEVKAKYKLNDIVIVHALGRFTPGQAVVLVMVSSSRRDASFRALREAVERYKKEPALFKQEIYVDGSSAWIS
ncbi:MAG: molybdenum cofactor biosynthesis protein MoaE [Nitrososphaerota archaeon]|nr:molybdenum cofactor biosynthesis protein MoaE [Nitrososphaerota archaeon]